MKIIYEDSEIIVCRKEAGEPVQSARLGCMDIESRLRTHLRQAQEERMARAGRGALPAGAGEMYLGIIHRLDQPVQGLVVFAKNKRAAADLSAQVTDGRMEKYYLALVYASENLRGEAGDAVGAMRGEAGDAVGDLRGDAGGSAGRTQAEGWIQLTDALLRDPASNSSRVVPAGTRGAKQARLEYRIEEYRPGENRPAQENVPTQALLRIRLLTGRHHQIRVQLSHAGMPLVGDRKYGAKRSGEGEGGAKTTPFPALCACELSFLHPLRGDRMRFTVPKEEIWFLSSTSEIG